MSDDLRADVAELKRQMAEVCRICAGGFLTSGPDMIMCSDAAKMLRDLTTPLPKPRPVIEVVPRKDYFIVRCGGFLYSVWAVSNSHWHPLSHDYGSSSITDRGVALAIAAALRAVGNYPAEYKETTNGL